jgi:hypothetical protein
MDPNGAEWNGTELTRVVLAVLEMGDLAFRALTLSARSFPAAVVARVFLDVPWVLDGVLMRLVMGALRVQMTHQLKTTATRQTPNSKQQTPGTLVSPSNPLHAAGGETSREGWGGCGCGLELKLMFDLDSLGLCSSHDSLHVPVEPGVAEIIDVLL